MNTLCTSSQYDFEKGVMVDYKVTVPHSEKKSARLPKMQDSRIQRETAPFRRFILQHLAIEKNSK